MSYIEKVMVGMSVIGGALQTDPDAGTLMAFILLGKYDHELKCAHYFQHYGKEPANDAELEDPTVVVMLDRTKRFFRSIVQGIFDEAARQDQLDQEEKRKDLLQQLRESNKPMRWEPSQKSLRSTASRKVKFAAEKLKELFTSFRKLRHEVYFLSKR